MKKTNSLSRMLMLHKFGSVRRSYWLMLVAAGLVTFTGCDDDDDNTTNVTPQQVQTVSDKDFVAKAGMSNAAEIQLGQLAMSKAQHDSVKAFGKEMVNDHTIAQNELKTLGLTKNMPVPDTLDAAHKALKQQLSSLSGKAFDSVYINSQVTDHQKAKQDYQTEINTGQDQDIKNYASKYLPVIQMHLDKATSLKDTLSKK